MIFGATFRTKLSFEIFNLAVIPSQRPTLEASRGFLRHNNFRDKTKIPKIEKEEYWVDEPIRSEKMIFGATFRTKLGVEIFNHAVISSERPILEASRTFLRHNNFRGKTRIPKIEKDKYWVDEPIRSVKITFAATFRAKLTFQNFNLAVITSESPNFRGL